MNDEIWMDIPYFNGTYQASNIGRIKRKAGPRITRYGTTYIKKEHIMALCQEYDGYMRVSLRDENGSKKKPMVHRLVAAAFYGISEMEINHIDGIRSNNNVLNLEYVSRRENVCHAVLMSKETGGIGSTRLKNGKWLSQIKHNGKKIMIGKFDTESEASAAYVEYTIAHGIQNKYSKQGIF